MHSNYISLSPLSLKKLVHSDITRIGKESGLHSFEQASLIMHSNYISLSLSLCCCQAKAIELESELFSVDNNCLTPTFKLRRPYLKSKYMPTFVKLYSELPS